MTLFPLIYDVALAAMEGFGLRCWRRRLLQAARGQILEIGAGTGLNLLHYPASSRLVVTDPDREMLASARRRTRGIGPTSFVAADAQQLPFGSGTFDTVICTLVFCTIPRPEQAFAEIRRVLKAQGQLLLLEHVRCPRRWVGRLQDICTPLWKRLAHGCHLNRDTLALAQSQGFTVVKIKQGLDGWLLAAEMRPSACVARGYLDQSARNVNN